MSRKLKDHVVESNQIELKKNLDKIIKKTRYLKRWCDKNIERSDKSILLCNILSSVADHIEITMNSLDMHISVLALATRSQYELNVRLRSIIESEDEQQKWSSEAITDKVQALEGLLSLGASNENLHDRQILNSEISRLKNLVTKYNLPTIKQPESTGNLAKKVGLESEHKALFKLFSKLVHPSSFLVNDYANASSNENQIILQIYAQLYGTDSIERICKALSIPKETSKPYGQA